MEIAGSVLRVWIDFFSQYLNFTLQLLKLLFLPLQKGAG